LATFVGAGLVKGYEWLTAALSRRSIKRFWASKDSSRRLYLFHGAYGDVLTDLGELEPVMNVENALALVELKAFLEPWYQEIIVTADTDSIDWQFPVVSLGGPLPNLLTKHIGEQGHLPIWFLDMPYSADSQRALGTRGRAEVYRSEFSEDGELVSDVGFVARLRSPECPNQVLYVIASNYGIGNLGVVRYVTSARKLKNMLALVQRRPFFQAVIRSRVVHGKVVETQVVHHRVLGG
jgi:hypothetical protein